MGNIASYLGPEEKPTANNLSRVLQEIFGDRWKDQVHKPGSGAFKGHTTSCTNITCLLEPASLLNERTQSSGVAPRAASPPTATIKPDDYEDLDIDGRAIRYLPSTVIDYADVTQMDKTPPRLISNSGALPTKARRP